MESNFPPESSRTQPRDAQPAAGAAEPTQIKENISAVLDFYNREQQKLSTSQRIVERISALVAKPAFLVFILVVVVVWIATNLVVHKIGFKEFDPAPFFWLQGIVGLGALLTATVVLAKQDRLARLEERREHLDLKVALLTEQKVAKLIDLMEELRRDLPNVKDRHDSDAAALQQSLNPQQVLAALDERTDLDKPPPRE
jgi:uncharacterized membrane protein